MLPILALILAAFAWGSAFCFLKQLLDFLNPYYLLAFRFSLAALILCFIFFPRLKRADRRTLRHGVFLGGILYLEFLFYTIGLQYTTASKSALLCAGYPVILPLASLLVTRKRPSLHEVLASFVCMGGLVSILFSDFGALNIGDLLCCLTAVFYAVHILYTSIYAPVDDPILLNVLQISTGAILSWGSALFSGPVPSSLGRPEFSGILYLALVCTIIPYFLSVYGQRHVKASTSAILLSLESVFGAGLSFLVLGETLTPAFLFGTALVMGSTFLSEGKLPFCKKRSDRM